MVWRSWGLVMGSHEACRVCRLADFAKLELLNSLKGGYMGDYIGDYYRGY